MTFDYVAFAEFMASRGCRNPADIARELGVDPPVISKLSRGLQRPSIDFIALLWVKYPRLRRDRFLAADLGSD
jgi:hypothetical protein